jgi:hypothetical protein
MKIELKTISIRKFLLITLLSIPLIIGVPISLALLIDNSIFIVLIVPALIGIIIIGQKKATQISNVEFDNERLKVNDRIINFSSIKGYHLNDTALTMIAIEFKLGSNETFSITSTNSGIQFEKFNEFTKQLIDTIKKVNNNVEKLEYQDIHVKQMTIMRPIIIIGIILVAAFDIFAIYNILFGNRRIPWQIFLVNFLIIGLIPYLRNRK